jgi:hypothetical protein
MACAFLADIEGGDGRLGAVSAYPAHDRTAAAIRAISTLVIGPPTLPAFDFADLVTAFDNGGRAVFSRGVDGLV